MHDELDADLEDYFEDEMQEKLTALYDATEGTNDK